MSVVGENLKRLVHERGESLMWLSRASGVSKYTIYTITRSESIDVRPSTLNKLANTLNVPVTELTKDPNIIRENKETGVTIKKSPNPNWYVVESKGTDPCKLQEPIDLNTLKRKEYDVFKTPDELNLTESEKIGYFEQLEHTKSFLSRWEFLKTPFYDPNTHGKLPPEAYILIEERRSAESLILDTMFNLTPANCQKLVQYALELSYEQQVLYEQLLNNDKIDQKKTE